MVSPVIVARAGGGIAEGLISLIDQLGTDFSFAVKRGRMHEAIRMPDLHLFMPGAFNVSLRRVGRQFEDGVVVGTACLLHGVSWRGRSLAESDMKQLVRIFIRVRDEALGMPRETGVRTPRGQPGSWPVAQRPVAGGV